jgi:hypothetical protein
VDLTTALLKKEYDLLHFSTFLMFLNPHLQKVRVFLMSKFIFLNISESTIVFSFYTCNIPEYYHPYSCFQALEKVSLP